MPSGQSSSATAGSNRADRQRKDALPTQVLITLHVMIADRNTVSTIPGFLGSPFLVFCKHDRNDTRMAINARMQILKHRMNIGVVIQNPVKENHAPVCFVIRPRERKVPVVECGLLGNLYLVKYLKGIMWENTPLNELVGI